MKNVDYSNQYRNVDFRSRLEKCRIGRGEQGVLITEPYKSEILPYWRLKTPEFAKQSAIKIYAMFIQYGKNNSTYLELKEINKKRSKA